MVCKLFRNNLIVIYEMIVKIERSPVALKRFRVVMDNGNKYDFGYSTGKTYIDGRTMVERENYRKRHLANPIEKRLITNLVPSPSLFAYYLLWGPSAHLPRNVAHLNNLWEKKHNN